MSSKSPGEDRQDEQSRDWRVRGRDESFAWWWLRGVLRTDQLEPTVLRNRSTKKDGVCALAMALLAYMHADGSRCYPTDEQLAEHLELSTRAVQFRLAVMEAHGMVRRDTRKVFSKRRRRWVDDRVLVPLPPSQWVRPVPEEVKERKKGSSEQPPAKPPSQQDPATDEATFTDPAKPPSLDAAVPAKPPSAQQPTDQPTTSPQVEEEDQEGQGNEDDTTAARDIGAAVGSIANGRSDLGGTDDSSPVTEDERAEQTLKKLAVLLADRVDVDSLSKSTKAQRELVARIKQADGQLTSGELARWYAKKAAKVKTSLVGYLSKLPVVTEADVRGVDAPGPDAHPQPGEYDRAEDAGIPPADEVLPIGERRARLQSLRQLQKKTNAWLGSTECKRQAPARPSPSVGAPQRRPSFTPEVRCRRWALRRRDDACPQHLEAVS